MNEITYMEVDFAKYCPQCKYNTQVEAYDPCDECLEQGWNENSRKPIKFKPASNVAKNA